MSLDDYASWLVRVAMGWLGRSLEAALHSDCLDILIAFEGKQEMLVFMAGGNPAEAQPQKLTQAAMRGFFGKSKS